MSTSFSRHSSPGRRGGFPSNSLQHCAIGARLTHERLHVGRVVDLHAGDLLLSVEDLAAQSARVREDSQDEAHPLELELELELLLFGV